jgi:hypothetical protein
MKLVSVVIQGGTIRLQYPLTSYPNVMSVIVELCLA